MARRQHDNTNPVTKEPLAPSELITLNYARKSSGEIYDPISFKPFSEHSHIVAIASTGNVFLAESIKGGRDLVADVRFKKYVFLDSDLHCAIELFELREDVITLQNPHGFPTASVAKPVEAKSSASEKTQAVAKVAPAIQAQTKATIPCTSVIDVSTSVWLM